MQRAATYDKSTWNYEEGGKIEGRDRSGDGGIVQTRVRNPGQPVSIVFAGNVAAAKIQRRAAEVAGIRLPAGRARRAGRTETAADVAAKRRLRSFVATSALMSFNC